MAGDPPKREAVKRSSVVSGVVSAGEFVAVGAPKREAPRKSLVCARGFVVVGAALTLALVVLFPIRFGVFPDGFC